MFCFRAALIWSGGELSESLFEEVYAERNIKLFFLKVIDVLLTCAVKIQNSEMRIKGRTFS